MKMVRPGACLLLLFSALAFLSLAAAASAVVDPPLTPLAENLSLPQAAAAEGKATFASLEPPRTVTVLHVDGPGGEYPGSRPAAPGPFWIDVTLEAGMLVVLAAAAVITAAGYVVYRKRKAADAAGSAAEEDRPQG